MHDIVRNLREARNNIIARYNVPRMDNMYILMHPKDIRIIGGASWLLRYSQSNLRDIYLHGMKVVESVDIPEGEPIVVWWPNV